MSIKIYDEAILKKLKYWIKDPNMTVTSPDETSRIFEYYADKTKDNVKLPIIALRREPRVEILQAHKKPMSFMGYEFKTVDDSNRALIGHLDAIPIRLNYQLDIYCRYFDEADEYFRNLVFNIVNYPTLEYDIPYNGITIHRKAFMDLGSEMNDNSSIPERLVEGQFTRLTISFTLNDAYLYSTEVDEPKKLVIEGLYLDDEITGDSEYEHT